MATIDSVIVLVTLLENDGVYPGTEDEPADPPIAGMVRYLNSSGALSVGVAFRVQDLVGYLALPEATVLFHGGVVTPAGREFLAAVQEGRLDRLPCARSVLVGT